MQLYLTFSSPFARQARILVQEQKLNSVATERFSHPFHNEDELLCSNPLGKVPFLSLDNGISIIDSEIVCAYRDKRLGDGRPSQPLNDHWELQTLHSVCSVLMDTAVHLQMEKLRTREGLRSEFWRKRYLSAIVRSLDYLEKNLTALPRTLSLVHINLCSALSYIDFRHENIDWRLKHPQLTLLAKTLEAKESFTSCKLHE
ncbi:glutathione S-transferase N-terminal domain-containing protein [Microbulbifer sp. OS29]|uniref:Glutathione S-transferase N-terminal domain-containing protein n=1 Tax=Microbulbifer okhotskensis TaxID=2926617 RepID=A0A9X2ETF4_9GAMM|nr:glutathione S-transferase N-terminal domain-containing protein [Microbulbifer okhotskensis]MCO1335453.1 glutathione S-transferase N-terminal domain-containing protein [Microbulbifer okhotskensis]